MDRREVLRWISAGAVAGGSSLFSQRSPLTPLWAQEKPASTKGLPALKIKDRLAGKRVALICSGGNLSLKQLREVL